MLVKIYFSIVEFWTNSEITDNKQERSRRGCIYPYVIYLIGVSYCLLRNQGKSRSLYVVTFNQLALICITMEYLENKRQFICQTIVSFFLLGLGGSIYLLFRPKTLLMFKWVDSLGLSEYLDLLRDMVSDITLNHITLYSLPDGLWLASYIIVVNTIVSKNNKYNLLFWSLLLPFIAIVFELLQIPGIIPGVYDVFDLICYIIPLIIYLIYLKYEKYI